AATRPPNVCRRSAAENLLQGAKYKKLECGLPARLTSILQAGMPAFQYSFTLQNTFATMTKSLLQGVKWFCRYDKVIIAPCNFHFAILLTLN
ncbi:MAG: hypothetical protein IIU03_14135, partial [Bacteroidales bacterium]|nr:hypothetical protein [Bacteroidales bacterium]